MRVTIFVDKEGKIAYIDQKVGVRNHGEQVVKKLKELKVDMKPESSDEAPTKDAGEKSDGGKKADGGKTKADKTA